MASKTSIKSHQVKVLYWWNQVVRSATTIARKTKVPVSTVHNNLKKLNNKENLNRKKGSGGKRLITSLNEWQNQWLNTTKASKTKQFFPNIYDRLKNKRFRPNFIISQYTSGHGNFRTYFKRFNLYYSDVCECDQSIGTPNHIIFECEKYNNQRFQLINLSHRLGYHWPIPLNSLISHQFIEEFLFYLKNIYNSLLL